ncbi:hypothetical protein JST97_26165 [bacterium]|nr:hypothetical protein [bacterium]
MPSDSAESNSAYHPPEGGLHRSALLGHRKTRSTALEKPQAFTPKERPPKAAPPPPPEPVVRPEPQTIKATPKTRAAKAPAAPKKAAVARAKAPDAVAFQALVEEVARLSQALASRPDWADLKALESRLSGPAPSADPGEIEHLQELLRTREEELEELGSVVSEFQEQNEQAYSQLRELTARLRQAQEEARQAVDRQRMAEGFLREALLGLLSPGDEFNEDLVEQIQHFLQPG